MTGAIKPIGVGARGMKGEGRGGNFNIIFLSYNWIGGMMNKA